MWQIPQRQPHTSDTVDRQQWEVREGREKRQGEREGKEMEGKKSMEEKVEGMEEAEEVLPKFYIVEYFVGIYEYEILRKLKYFASRQNILVF